MAEDIKWIKLSTGILDDEKIVAIEGLEDGPCLCWMWIKLLALAGRQNCDGRISLTEEIPFTNAQLASRFRMTVGTIQHGLNVFQEYGMIEIINEMIYTSNWARYQDQESLDLIRKKSRDRVKNYRDRKRQEENAMAEHPPEKEKTSATERRFARFWDAYPKKVGKGAAEKSFAKFKPDDSLTDTMIQAIEAQKRTRQWKEGYIPNPATWLNQRRWEDEIEELPFSDPNEEPAYIRDESIEDWN